jgi:hypothetical protein
MRRPTGWFLRRRVRLLKEQIDGTDVDAKVRLGDLAVLSAQ